MISIYSPAKVNLIFKVISKRKDGYYNIASLYQAISLMDFLTFKKSKKDSFFCCNNELKWRGNNLIKKAVEFFRNKTKIFDPIEIYLKKNIPLRAGLGGGSSNAATTLWALNELFLRPLKIQELIEISKSIGSDVTFFFSLGTAFCIAKGNIFENISIYDMKKFYIAKPSFGISTKEVYENLDINLLEKKDLKDLKKSMLNNNFTLFNDLEISAFELNNRLYQIKQQLIKMGFEKVIMSGSGSSFICIGNIKPIKLKKVKFFQVFPVQRNQKKWYFLKKE